MTTPPPRAAGPESPQQRYSGAAFASWGRRALGFLIDIAGVWIIARLVGLVDGGLLVESMVWTIGLLVLGWMNGASGRTPGKRVVGIRVVRDADGMALGGGLGIVRSICHFLDTIACLIGWLWPLWDVKNQTFADKILATVAIRA